MFQRLKNILIGEPLTHDDSGDGHLLSKIQALAMVVNPYWTFGSRPFGQSYHFL